MSKALYADRYTVPDMPSADEILPYLREIDHNLWYSNHGPMVSTFEKRFAERMAAAHGDPQPFYAVTLASGYTALRMGLRLLGVTNGWNVLMPAVNFPACPHAVSNMGGTPILCDVDEAEWTLTPAIARAVAAKTKIDVVVPVSLYGIGLPAQEWDAFTEETGIPVLIDAAAAIETQTYLRRGLVAHSMHATKPFGVGEGGMLVTADPDMAQKIRITSNFGMVDRLTLYPGENAKMSEYYGAIGLVQLERWEKAKRCRAKILSLYASALEKVDGMASLHPALHHTIVSCLMLRVAQGKATEIVKALADKGIASHRTYFPPLYAHPFFAALTRYDAQGTLVQDAVLPVCAALEQSVLGLPFFPLLSADDVGVISDAFALSLQETL
ncbi:MAG: DegT/DnrJ/EryC1/StrS family aminotransferase [Bdellovibrionales bacterium]